MQSSFLHLLYSDSVSTICCWQCFYQIFVVQEDDSVAYNLIQNMLTMIIVYHFAFLELIYAFHMGRMMRSSEMILLGPLMFSNEMEAAFTRQTHTYVYTCLCVYVSSCILSEQVFHMYKSYAIMFQTTISSMNLGMWESFAHSNKIL